MAIAGTLVVVLGDSLPRRIIAHPEISTVVCERDLFDHSLPGVTWLDLEDYREIPNIQEAYELIGKVYQARFVDGSSVTKEMVYKGHELVWYFQKVTYLRHLLPYLEWRNLFDICRHHSSVHIYDATFHMRNLFRVFCEAYGIRFASSSPLINRLKKILLAGYELLSQAIKLVASFLSFFVLVVRRPGLLVWQGSDIINMQDYDFRYEYIYRELRERNINFVEFLRSRQPLTTIIKNMWVRRRPVIYHDSSLLLSPFIPAVLARRLVRKVRPKLPAYEDEESGLRRFFLLLVSLQFEYCFYLRYSSAVLRNVIKAIGIKVCFTPAAPYRNGGILLACKLLKVPIVGMQASNSVRFYEIEEYYPGITAGAPSPACDIWGVWSPYYRDYVIRHSNVYNDSNTFVSGSMRPLHSSAHSQNGENSEGDLSTIRVLLISEPLTDPGEVAPYLEKIVGERGLRLSVKCRPDGTDNIIPLVRQYATVELLTGSLEEAYGVTDVVIGSRSTAVVEGMVALKPIALLNTRRWGDFFECNEGKFGEFVEGPHQVVAAIKAAASTPPLELKRRRDYMWGDLSLNGAATIVTKIVDLIEKR